MKFATQGETNLAMLSLLRWMPDLIQGIEAGLVELKIEIKKKEMRRYTDGGIDPVLHLEHPGDDVGPR